MGEMGRRPPPAPNGPPSAGAADQPPPETRPDLEAAWQDEADGDSAADERQMVTGPVIRDQDDPAKDRRSGRTVVAEWALWGKEAGDLEYRILRCSKGPFGPGDFRGVLNRYTPGDTQVLPQYTVCWIPDENAHERYLAIAIHELADLNPRRSGGRVRSARGREIEYIRLFCVRYTEMAQNQLGYAELLESVLGYQLPAGRTSPIKVELLETEPPSFPPSVSALAENAATLLLTGQPVCVLGAERATAEDRLRFIDQVMWLLPYGLRATMSAATWASATAKNLKLRLIFTSAERDDGATSYLTWGAPMRFDLSAREVTLLRHYVNWLDRGGANAPELVGQIRQMIANLPRDRPVKDTLEELADALRDGKVLVVRAAVRRLRQRRSRPRSLDERKHYRQEIRRLGLLREHTGVPARTAASVYRVLLELAFGSRLTYANYRDIVQYAGGPPRGLLGREMLKLKFSSFLPWLLTAKSSTELTDRELVKSLHEQGIEAAAPLTEFCRHLNAVDIADRPAGYDFAVGYLRAYGEDSRAELEGRGYLTQTLERVFPDNQRAQCRRLKETLVFVYGAMLSEEQRSDLLGRTDVHRTPAFVDAVTQLTARPATSGWRLLRIKMPQRTAWARGARPKITISGVAILMVSMLIVGLVIVILMTHLLESLHV
jgi:hypothetical protein